MARSDRLPPQDLDAERSVLGGILVDNDRLDDVSGLLSQDSFYLHANGWIFAAIQRLRAKKGRRAYDPVTIHDELKRMGKLDELGDDPPGELIKLMAAVPHSAHVPHYAGIVAEKHRRRQLIDVGRQSIRDGHDADELGAALDANATALHRVIEHQAGSQSAMKPLGDCMVEFWDRQAAEKPPGLPMGFQAIDQKISPRPGNLVILAARPSMGKTALAGCVGINVARDTGPVGFISLEQSADEITDRIVAAQTGVPLNAILKNRLSSEDKTKIMEFGGWLGELPFYIDDGGKTLSQVVATLRFMRRKHGICMAVIDYLQIIDPDDRRMPREQQIATATRTLKHLAKDLNIPIIALSQLNRDLEKRPNKRPQLSDLRESGAIEQDADLVTFLHRPEWYDPADQPGLAEFIIAKHRSGQTGMATLAWRGETTSFEDMRYDSPTVDFPSDHTNYVEGGAWYTPPAGNLT